MEQRVPPVCERAAGDLSPTICERAAFYQELGEEASVPPVCERAIGDLLPIVGFAAMEQEIAPCKIRTADIRNRQERPIPPVRGRAAGDRIPIVCKRAAVEQEMSTQQ